MQSPPDTLEVLCWNIFHGRDAPPDPALFTKRARWLRRTEDNGEYVQVNRSLLDEYSSLIAGAAWSVCLLQECPPAWARPLARQTRATGQRVLTSRNQLGPISRLAGRLNPDLVGSNEGGSNMLLARAPWTVSDRRNLLLNPWPARGLAERRRMSFARLRSGQSSICVTNLHATAHGQEAAEHELLRGAAHAIEWAAGDPLLFGGDFNVRPHSSRIYEQLESRFGLKGTTAPDAIDHLLARGLEVIRAPDPWPVAARELDVRDLGAARKLRLSDHAPVTARFVIPPARIR